MLPRTSQWHKFLTLVPLAAERFVLMCAAFRGSSLARPSIPVLVLCVAWRWYLCRLSGNRQCWFIVDVVSLPCRSAVVIAAVVLLMEGGLPAGSNVRVRRSTLTFVGECTRVSESLHVCGSVFMCVGVSSPVRVCFSGVTVEVIICRLILSGCLPAPL